MRFSRISFFLSLVKRGKIEEGSSEGTKGGFLFPRGRKKAIDFQNDYMLLRIVEDKESTLEESFVNERVLIEFDSFSF